MVPDPGVGTGGTARGDWPAAFVAAAAMAEELPYDVLDEWSVERGEESEIEDCVRLECALVC